MIVEVLTAGLPVGIALYDIDLRHRFVNEPRARMRGMPAADHVGRRAPELLPDFGAEIERHLREVLEHGEPLPEMHVTGELPGRPGSEVHELRSYFPLRAPDGLLSGIGVTVVDVTERASAAALAREERDLYQALLQAQSELGEAVVVLQDLRVVLAKRRRRAARRAHAGAARGAAVAARGDRPRRAARRDDAHRGRRGGGRSGAPGLPHHGAAP